MSQGRVVIETVSRVSTGKNPLVLKISAYLLAQRRYARGFSSLVYPSALFVMLTMSIEHISGENLKLTLPSVAGFRLKQADASGKSGLSSSKYAVADSSDDSEGMFSVWKRYGLFATMQTVFSELSVRNSSDVPCQSSLPCTDVSKRNTSMHPMGIPCSGISFMGSESYSGAGGSGNCIPVHIGEHPCNAGNMAASMAEYMDTNAFIGLGGGEKNADKTGEVLSAKE